jgi:pimeloyl-ACP methyl ester carboxylesterase
VRFFSLRAAGWLALFVAGLWVCHLLARGLVAAAIANAPNRALASAPALDEPPPELARYGTKSVQIEVGSPKASLSTWVLEPPDAAPPRGTVVVLHGIRLDKRSMLPAATALAEAGFRSVLPDLRGHGRSSGQHLTYGLVESRDISELLDALAARGMALGPVGVYGYSYGGATAIHLAARDPRVVAAVSVAAFSSLRVAARDYLRRYVPGLEPAVPDTWLDDAIDQGGRMADFDPDAAAPARSAAHTRAKILVVHGTLDEQIPVAHAETLERSAPGHVQKLLLDGQTHASVLSDPKHIVTDAARRWFERELRPVGALGATRI